MTTEELLAALWRALAGHLQLPPGYEWAPTAGLVATALFGLLLMTRGARWAPALAGVTFCALGAGGGALLARVLGTPTAPTAVVAAVATLAIGLLAFRLWQALLLAACFATLGIGVYYVRELTPHVRSWLDGGLEGGEIALPPAGSVTANHSSAATELSSLWAHLAQNVDHFTTTFVGLALLTAAAGLVFGLLLPKASRALWSATLGTILLGVGIAGLLEHHAPQTLAWLTENNAWAWSIVACIWVVSVVYNLLSVRTPRRGEPPVATAPAPAVRT